MLGNGPTIEIAPNEVHLWFVFTEKIQDDNLIKDYMKLLNPEEVARHDRFVFQKDRKQYAITRALVRTVLSKYINQINPEGWEFIANEYGKPEIRPDMLPFALKFNISHTNKMIVLAVSHSHEVGVDVESYKRKISSDELAEYSFSESEYRQLKQINPVDFRERFFDYWTFKEAYIKACGMGLYIPLKSFSFTFSSSNKVSILFEKQRQDEPQDWKFWQMKVGHEFTVSLAVKSEIAKAHYSILTRQYVPLENYMLVESTFSMES